ncbi:hypothetical protein KAI04_01075 [Candidatus Pacearchaeota archaeon]|nr:hypothetical protein [Candidatus Pacearchaeota archaeon]
MEKIFENLEKSEKTIQTADHLLHVTYPLVKDKRLLLKILVEIKKGIASCINAVLQYEYLYGRVRLSTNPKLNFKKFLEKCCPRYNIPETNVKKIIKLFDIVEKHKSSPMEFVKEDKIVILSENMSSEIITLEKVKEFIDSSKIILQKSKKIILR